MRKLFLFAGTFALCLCAPAYAQTAPSVVVRVGAHETYDRVVFDWPKNIGFRVRHEGERASITFEAPANVKIPPGIGNTLDRAQGFKTQTDGKSSVTVSFFVDPDANVKAFTNDNSVVVDIRGKSAPRRDVPPPPTPAKAAELLPDPQPEPKAATDKPVLAETKPAVSDAPSRKTEAAPEILKSQPAPTPMPARPAVVSESRVKVPEFSFTASDVPTLVATLDPHLPTRAVIFSRADVGYIVFDKKISLSPTALLNGAKALVDIQTFEMATKSSGYRFAVPPGSSMQATLDGTAWKIFVSKKHESFSVTTTLIAQPDFALGARLLLPLPDAPDPIRFTDPIVGDDLILVPLGQSQAFNVRRQMADLTILPAAQGLVIKPLTDKVIARAVSDGIEISAQGGLMLSRVFDTGTVQQSASKIKAAAAGKSIFDFAAWRGKPGESFTETRQSLQQTIVDVPETERNRARMELARFYFARGQGEEASSMLEYIAKQVPDLRFHADFMALLGAAKILAYRSEEGLGDLTTSALVDQPEVGLWQAVGLAQLREWQKAEDLFSTRENILAGYPEPFYSRFFVLAIESAIAANQSHEAADWLNYVSNTPHAEAIDPALNFLRGAIDAQAGHAREARIAWKKAETSSDRLYKVRAELALIDLDVAEGSLTPAQAADRLEALRFAWRGDDLELDILHRLGQFYIRAKNMKAGMAVLARATALYPSNPMSGTMRDEMATAFRDIFLGTASDKLSPLDALSLYRQYRDLLPSDKNRDSIMLRLAERLIAVDLLDQASSILEDLAKNHFQGQDKESAVLRLAAIRLLDHKPVEALAALDILGKDALQPPAQTQRLLLRARALSEMHRDDEASALLKDAPGADAALLRADIAMRAQNWDEAAKILLALVGPSSDKALTSEQADWLTNAAIAFALADDQANLDKLAIDYDKAMEAMPQSGAFKMLTRPEKTGQMRDLATAQSQLTQVDMFQSFLNNYRKAAQAGTEDTAKK